MFIMLIFIIDSFLYISFLIIKISKFLNGNHLELGLIVLIWYSNMLS